MGVVSESPPRSNSKSFVGRRRVSAVVAIPIVLMCGALGFLLGSVFPPDSFVARVQIANIKAIGTTVAPADVPVPQTSVAQGSSLVEQPAHGPLEAAQPEPPSLPAPEKIALDGAHADVGPSPPTDAKIAEEARDAPKGTTKKAARRTSEKRKGSPPNRAARASREPYPAGPSGPAPSPGIISQIPIVGPVVGLFMP